MRLMLSKKEGERIGTLGDLRDLAFGREDNAS